MDNFCPLLKTLILLLENARLHKMTIFPTVSSCKRILLDTPEEHLVLLRNCFRLSVVFKINLPKHFSCVNLSRVGSQNTVLKNTFLCKSREKRKYLKYCALTVVNTGQLSAEIIKSSSMTECCCRTNIFTLQRSYGMLLKEALSSNKEDKRNMSSWVRQVLSHLC